MKAHKISVKVVNHLTNEVMNVTLEAKPAALVGAQPKLMMSKTFTKDGNKVTEVENDIFNMMLAVDTQFKYIEETLDERQRKN